jgi:glycosyltransferase involved in cell wall biosynthesis
MRNGDRVRVLLVSPCFGAYGGVEAFVFAVADAVGRDPRFEVRVCFKRVADFLLQPALEQYCHAAPVEFCDRASRELWSAIGWADVVHAQNASPDVSMISALLRKPLALTIHDFLPPAPWLRRLSWQASARAASARWYNSRSVWSTWEPHGDLAASARVPTVSRFEPASSEASARRGFLFVGRLVDSKGVEVLLDAYQRASLDPAAWPLTIVGDGPLRHALEAHAARAGLAGVRFLGFVDDGMKARLLASAKWLVAPSHAHEGLGLVVLEARHAGVPCIITRHGGLPEAGGRDALICEPRDVDGLARLLETTAMMSESEYRERSLRTQAELATELVPMSFYGDAYLALTQGHRGRLPSGAESHAR